MSVDRGGSGISTSSSSSITNFSSNKQFAPLDAVVASQPLPSIDVTNKFPVSADGANPKDLTEKGNPSRENTPENHSEHKQQSFAYPEFDGGRQVSAAADARRRLGILASVTNDPNDSSVPKRVRERQVRGQLAQQEIPKHRNVLRRLRAWHAWDTHHYSSLSAWLLGFFGIPKRPDRPNDSELKQLAMFYFPPRAELKVSICDFGEGKLEECETTLGQVEQCRSSISSISNQGTYNGKIGRRSLIG